HSLKISASHRNRRRNVARPRVTPNRNPSLPPGTRVGRKRPLRKWSPKKKRLLLAVGGDGFLLLRNVSRPPKPLWQTPRRRPKKRKRRRPRPPKRRRPREVADGAGAAKQLQRPRKPRLQLPPRRGKSRPRKVRRKRAGAGAVVAAGKRARARASRAPKQ